MQKQLPLAAALGLLVLAGCQPQAASVVGKWKGKEVKGAQAASDSDKAALEMANSLVTQMEVDFKEDGTATMGFGGFNSNGKYSVAGSKITVTLEKSSMLGADAPEPKPFDMTLSADGKTLELKGEKPEQGSTIFERATPDAKQG